MFWYATTLGYGSWYVSPPGVDRRVNQKACNWHTRICQASRYTSGYYDSGEVQKYHGCKYPEIANITFELTFSQFLPLCNYHVLSGLRVVDLCCFNALLLPAWTCEDCSFYIKKHSYWIPKWYIRLTRRLLMVCWGSSFWKGLWGAVFLLGNTTGKHLKKHFMHSARTDPSRILISPLYTNRLYWSSEKRFIVYLYPLNSFCRK